MTTVVVGGSCCGSGIAHSWLGRRNGWRQSPCEKCTMQVREVDNEVGSDVKNGRTEAQWHSGCKREQARQVVKTRASVKA
eukprot:6469433-Amphidinium_carterae.2